MNSDLACVYFKNGQRRFGMLLQSNEQAEQAFRFVHHANTGKFLSTADDSLVEHLLEEEIEGIDLFMK
ncbi:MAG: hypothetical protein ACRCYO_15930 [Bacteroidia bacterium]